VEGDQFIGQFLNYFNFFRKKTMGIIGKDEQDDFLNVLLSAGLKGTDFDLSENETNTQSVTGVFAIKGTVTVLRKSNNHKKTYPAGHGATWLAQFEKDLKAGVFGS
jgi:hypothetical protein